MKPTTYFTVSEFENPSSEIVFRVSGWLYGKRVRKNFSSRADAEAERQTLEVQRLRAEGGIHTAATRLTDDQLHEAESAFRRLADRKRSLLFYLDYALANYREPEREKLVSDAVAAYLVVRTKDHDRGLLSTSAKKQIGWELDAFKKHFGKESVAQITVQQLQPFLERAAASLKTFNNRRAIVHTFFRFAFMQDWVVGNPLAKIPHYRIAHRRGSAVTLTAQQCVELMALVETVAEGKLVPFFALCLFAGIRPSLRDGEISKLRPEHIRMDTGSILIEPEVSKVRMKRLVTIQPNLAAWLQAYPFAVIDPHSIEHYRKAITEKFHLTHDVLRHTFISMHVAKFRSMGDAALQAGNSEAIIRKHYLDLKSKEEAEKFFGIFPKKAASAQAVAAVIRLAEQTRSAA